MSRRGVWILLAVLVFAFMPAIAGEQHDAAFYKRTATKPPRVATGAWYLGFRGTGANHSHGVGLATAGQWRNVGKYHVDIIWNGDVSRLHLEGQTAIIPLTIGCRDYLVPFALPDKDTTQYGTSVLFRVGR